MLKLPTAGVIAPAENLPLALLTCTISNLLPVSLTPLANLLPFVTAISVNLGKDVFTTPAVNLTPVPTDAGGHFFEKCHRHRRCTFSSEYLREFSKHFDRT